MMYSVPKSTTSGEEKKMPDLRLGVQFQPKGRWYFALVANAEEAYSAIQDLLVPWAEEIGEGLLFRRINDFKLEENANWEWRDWQGEDGESFKDFCENTVRYEQEAIADGDIPTVR